MERRRLEVEECVRGLAAGDRGVLARAITLVESQQVDDEGRARELLAALRERPGSAHRVGISGVPGGGKSTLIERLGQRLIARGQRVAVLAIDPSSTVSGGSILGDKSRMTELARDPQAFVRPSPSATTLGGVARRTRESMLLCEAAGYDVVLLETVGVGQSETLVADMVDCLVVLLVAGAGDELQGIKRGILEMADLVVVHKADGDNVEAARAAAAECSAALRMQRPRHRGWTPRALTASAQTGEGVDDLWTAVLKQREALQASGEAATLRAEQSVRWMTNLAEQRLLRTFREDARMRARRAQLEDEVRAGRLGAEEASDELLREFRSV